MTLKNYEPTDQLLNTIQKRFPHLEFHLLLIVEEIGKDNNRVNNRVTTVFLEDHLLSPGAQQTHWSLTQYDWEKIFKEFILIIKK